ncbi:putative maf-like protein [Babesia sp. Xinjiang]|uniref:putative maf-like protein n=1 Tax=Babesia sp. Xinjiang TaxID=462227 RepID=UPI000A265824|nr:putative maf-like protein [Babesia sp. Xinjiang]ORM40131.1 putative maf-like protein [Babesia sp. Xinjiang]
MPVDILECCLEFLASQIEPVRYDCILSTVVSEYNLPDLEKAEKVKLWKQLSADPDLLLFHPEDENPTAAESQNEPAEPNPDSNSSPRTDKEPTEDPSSSAENDEEKEPEPELSEDEYLEKAYKTRLLCSNSLRLKKFNLTIYDSVVKSKDRFRILVAVASRRYEGYWQHDLVRDLGISPRDIFSHMLNMTKLSLMCRVSVPQDCVSKQLLKDKINEMRMQRRSGGPKTGGEGLPRNSGHMATLWFFSRYFILERLPKWIQEVCFNRPTEATRERMMRILEESSNRIILESDWKSAYCSILLENAPGAHLNVDSRAMATSFAAFRRRLENKHKVSRVFAWCPQTNRYERCIIPYSGAAELLNRPENPSKNISTVRVVDLDSRGLADLSSTAGDDASCKTPRVVYQCPYQMRGHTLQECVYYLVRCHPGGIAINDLNNYLHIPYKLLSKIMSGFDSSHTFSKQPHRDGKLRMHLYSIPAASEDSPVPVPTTDGANATDPTAAVQPLSSSIGGVTASLYSTDSQSSSIKDRAPGVGGRSSGPSQPTAVDGTNDAEYLPTPRGSLSATSHSPDESLSLPYSEWIKKQQAIYYKPSIYEERFKLLFGFDFCLPNALNTPIFRMRMLLLIEYIENFRAASCNTIAVMYGDMNAISGKRVDRKTVIRVADFVMTCRDNIGLIRSQELEGVKLAVTVIYDRHKMSALDAYHLVSIELNRKRQIMCSHVATLKTRINKSFKGPGDTSGLMDVACSQDEGDFMGPLNMESATLLKGIAVTKKETSETAPDTPFPFSQRVLSDNGYIFPMMTRVRCLHYYLLDFCSRDRRYSALDMLNNMPMDIYLQVIGCGYRVRSICDLLEGTVLPVHLEDRVLNAFYQPRGRRSPVNRMHRMLNILAALGLVKSHRTPLDPDDDGDDASIKECVIEWELTTSVTLHSFSDPSSIVGRYDLPSGSNRFWQALQTETDAYLSRGHAKIPDFMPVREIFSKKNWKRSVYVGNFRRGQLESCLSSWLQLTSYGVDYRNILKLLYMPSYLVELISQRHNVSCEHLFNYIIHRVKSNSNTSPRLIVGHSVISYVKGLTWDREFLWLAKYVLAERLCNAIFYDRLASLTITTPDGPITWGALRTKLLDADEKRGNLVKRRKVDEVEVPATVTISEIPTPYGGIGSRVISLTGDEDETDDISRDDTPSNVVSQDTVVPRSTSTRHDSAASVGMGKRQRLMLRMGTKRHSFRREPDSTSLSQASNDDSDSSQSFGHIWSVLSLLFDRHFSPTACHYIFDHILNKSTLSIRHIRRLRQMTSVDIMHSAMKCHIPTYRVLTNKHIAFDHMEYCMKSMLFTPLVCMRPWFLDTMSEFLRGRFVLRQWSDNGWVVRTKQTSNMYTLFRLSTYAKVKLFGKFSDLEFTANVLLSHLRISDGALDSVLEISDDPPSYDVEVTTNNSLDVDGTSRKRGLPSDFLATMDTSDSLGASLCVAPASFIRTSEELTMHDVYALMNHFVSGRVSFKPVWTHEEQISLRHVKRAKTSHDRLNDGGISRHIGELTPNTPSVSYVTVGLSIPDGFLPMSRPSSGSSDINNWSTDQIVTRELVCGSRFSDALNPVGCPSSCLANKVDTNYPLSNVEYISDREHGWWSNRQYVSVPVESRHFSVSNLSNSSESSSETTADTDFIAAMGLPPLSCVPDSAHLSSLESTSGREYLRRVFVRAISSLFGALLPELESRLDEFEDLLYELVCLVRSSGSGGIKESFLYSKFCHIYSSESMTVSLPSPFMYIAISKAVFEVLIVSADVLRLVSRISCKEDFLCVYWEISGVIHVTPEPVIGVRLQSKFAKSLAAGTISTGVPEYIPELFWFLYEYHMDPSLANEPLEATLGRLASLFEEEDDRNRFKLHRLKSPLCAFVSLDGHLNRCVLAFLMLRIAWLLKSVPGQTVEEVWEKLVLFDLCEVRLVLRGMVNLGICRHTLLATSLRCDSDCSGLLGDSSPLTYFIGSSSIFTPLNLIGIFQIMAPTTALALGDKYNKPEGDWIVIASESVIRAFVLRQHLNINNVLMIRSGFPEDLDKSQFSEVGDYVRSTADGKARIVAERIFRATTFEEKRDVLDALSNPFGTIPEDFDIRKIQLVIGADTVCHCGGNIFEKPANETEALYQLKSYQKYDPECVTGVSAYSRETGCEKPVFSFYDRTTLRFQKLTDEDLEAYVAIGEYVGTAGSCRVTGYAESMVERIEGCYTTIIGMPAQKLSWHICQMVTGGSF